MPRITGFKSVLRHFEKLERASEREHTGDVLVGYAASYALYVHENKEMKLKGEKRGGKMKLKGKKRGGKKSKNKRKGKYWDPQGIGQSKFLEQPAREFSKEMGHIIRESIKKQGSLGKGASLIKALIVAGLRLQRESQKLVPVDTGNLRGSAFTEKE